MRRNKWVPRRAVAGPKTIDQIHEEAHRENQQQMIENLVSSKQGQGGNRGNDARKKSSRGPHQQQQSEDGWSMVPAARNRNFDKIDTNKLQNLGNRKPVDTDVMTLGPSRGGMNNWSKGSAGSRSSQSKEQNRFAPFGGSQMDSSSPSSDNFDNTNRRGASRSMGPPPMGRSSRGTSVDERNRAIQAVKGINTPPPTSNQPPMMSSSLKPPQGPPGKSISNPPPQMSSSASAPALQLLGKPDVNEDEMKDAASKLLEEFFHNCDVKEATRCVSEEFHKSNVAYFVQCAIELVLERSEQVCLQFCFLIQHF